MPLNPPITDWNGRVAWLLGASSGIGRATAARLHAAGATVVVSARNTAALDDFVRQHPGSRALPLDGTDRAAVRDAAARIVADCGRIDFVLYGAGHYAPMRATAFDLDEALRHQQVNVVGALHLLDATLPVLLRQRSGHLSLISSVAGWRGLPQALAYGPTKAALISLAQTLWLDLSGHGIGVSVVCPGFVDTPLTAQNRHPMPGLISADEAARRMLEGWRRGRFELHFPRRFTLWLKLLSLLGLVVGDGPCFRIVRRFTGL